MYCSYDYEEVDSDKANKVMEHIESTFASSSFVGSTLEPSKKSSSGSSFTVKETGNFSYTDPIDGSVAKNQGLYVRFEDGSRVVFRLSGTGSSGATIRLYVEKYTKDEKRYEDDTQDGLADLIDVALSFSKLREFTGRDKPTVITVSSVPIHFHLVGD
jgi:phosphoglucomutase